MKTALGESAKAAPNTQTVHNELEINGEALSFNDETAVTAFAKNFIAGAEIGYLQLTEDQIILRGKASSLSAQSSIGKEAAALIKDGVVLNQIEIIAQPTARPLFVDCLVNRVGGANQGSLRGELPSEDLRTEILAAAQESAPELVWKDEMRVSEEVETPSWASSLPAFVGGYLSNKRQGAFFLRGKNVQFLEMPDPIDRARTTILAEKQLDPEVKVTFDKPLVSSSNEDDFGLSAMSEDEWVMYQGVLPSSATKERLLGAISLAYPDARVIDYTQIRGGDRPEWESELPGFVRGYQEEHGLTDFTLSGNQLTLIGQVKDEATRNSIELWASTVFNVSLEIDNRLQVGTENSNLPEVSNAFVKPSPAAVKPQLDLEELGARLRALPIYFGSNEAAVASSEMPKIRQAVKILDTLDAQIPLVAAGFADSSGNADYNKALSLRRAANVKAALAKLGVAAKRVSLSSFGASKSGESNQDSLDKDRRVEIHLGKLAPQP